MNEITFSWEDYNFHLLNLGESILNSIHSGILEIQTIYGIPRGGLIISTCLSYSLDKPLILNSDKILDNTLIVDDIADSGKTLKEYKNNFNLTHNKIATLILNKSSDIVPDFYSYLNTENKWINFPYELNSNLDTISLVQKRN